MQHSPETKQPEPKKKPPYAKGIEWLSESIDIKVMFRIKGKQGIFMPVTKPNKSNMIRMVRFMLDEAYTINKSLLQCLGGSVIYTYGGKITLLEAFDNLQKHFKNQPTKNINWNYKLKAKDTIMDIICPNYNPYEFKDYHAKKIITWYNEIISAINKASN